MKAEGRSFVIAEKIRDSVAGVRKSLWSAEFTASVVSSKLSIAEHREELHWAAEWAWGSIPL